MVDDIQNSQPISDVEQIKTDLTSLYSHVSRALGKKTEEVRAKWGETRDVLEERRSALEERAKHLTAAGVAASADMKSGFASALSELKKALTGARSRFGE
jgi:ElaB/YqjD/DUF883 family membrane-anchored ribosome-binding protein